MIYYVNADAFRSGDGTQERPFKRINDAAQIAVPGDEIVVQPGVYREHVIPRNAGTAEKPIVYRSAEPRKAVITGAEPLPCWQRYQGDVWTARVNNGVFGA